MIKKSVTKTASKVTFVLPLDEPACRVSVVGDFNEWTPGVHELRKRSNGTRSVSVAIPKGETVRFRYLGEDGMWFDDPQADEVTHDGGLVTV
jgi:1,4-alpha-glucan branching enzyme